MGISIEILYTKSIERDIEIHWKWREFHENSLEILLKLYVNYLAVTLLEFLKWFLWIYKQNTQKLHGNDRIFMEIP